MILFLYLLTVVFSFGALNADRKALCRTLKSLGPAKEYREGLGMTVLYALLPIINVATAIFGTSFFMHGFDWSFTFNENTNS